MRSLGSGDRNLSSGPVDTVGLVLGVFMALLTLRGELICFKVFTQFILQIDLSIFALAS